MNNEIKEYLDWSLYNNVVRYGKIIIRPWAVCKDGFSLSIQESPMHNSGIDKDGNMCVEIAFAKQPIMMLPWQYRHSIPIHHKELLDYYDGLISIRSHDEKKIIDKYYYYSYVPVQKINKILLDHGGIDYKKTVRYMK